MKFSCVATQRFDIFTSYYKRTMMNIKALILLCTLFAGVLCACKKSDMDEKLAEEKQKLAEDLTTTFGEAAIPLGGGAYLVKTHEEPEGAIIEAGNYILWNREITNYITGDLEYTSEKSSIKFPDSYVDGGPEITLVQSEFPIDEGLKKMSKGEKGDIYIPSCWLYYDFQPRIYSVEIVNVIRDLTVYQEALMYGYLKRLHRGTRVDTIPNVVSTIDKDETGYNVMYHILDQGTGEDITKNRNIETTTSISYMIRENNVRSYKVDQDQIWYTHSGQRNTLTKTNCVGEILEKMKKGGKVVVTMPSKLYWEDDNLPRNEYYDQYYIPKWSVVIFTITVK